MSGRAVKPISVSLFFVLAVHSFVRPEEPYVTCQSKLRASTIGVAIENSDDRHRKCPDGVERCPCLVRELDGLRLRPNGHQLCEIAARREGLVARPGDDGEPDILTMTPLMEGGGDSGKEG